jgi:hypothetical protein
MHFTRAIEADPERAGLLYAGTERGMYISFDDGASWQSFQLNLPEVPVTDLEWKDHDLVVATQGRAFWVLDDLMHLHHVQAGDETRDFVFGSPYVATMGAENGARLRFWFREAPDSSSVTLRILEEGGDIIQTYSNQKSGSEGLDIEAGVNTFTWNMRYPDAESFDGLIMWAGSVRGPRAVPGTYKARLIVEDDSVDVEFELAPDPRSTSTLADLQEQFDFLIGIRDKLSEMHVGIKNIRAVRDQVNTILGRVPEDHAMRDTLKATAKSMLDAMRDVEEALYQTKNRSGQDPLNFPIRLNNKLAAVGGNASSGNYRPTDQAYAVRDELLVQIETELSRLEVLMTGDLPTFNGMVKEADLPAVALE